MKTIAIVSGGIDSVTLAYQLYHEGDDLLFLTFDYGQKHRKEIAAATIYAKLLNSPQIIFDLMDLGTNLNHNALTCETNVPPCAYDALSMSQTVVPARNAVMIAIATAIAVDKGYDRIALGVHGGDHFIYPDCRPEFIAAIEQVMQLATESAIEIHTPFIDKTKTNIIKIGKTLKIPYEHTWSCYNGQELHCGQCGTCIERRGAFRQANLKDPTIYDCEETT